MSLRRLAQWQPGQLGLCRCGTYPRGAAPARAVPSVSPKAQLRPVCMYSDDLQKRCARGALSDTRLCRARPVGAGVALSGRAAAGAHRPPARHGAANPPTRSSSRGGCCSSQRRADVKWSCKLAADFPTSP